MDVHVLIQAVLAMECLPTLTTVVLDITVCTIPVINKVSFLIKTCATYLTYMPLFTIVDVHMLIQITATGEFFATHRAFMLACVGKAVFHQVIGTQEELITLLAHMHYYTYV